MKIDTVFYYPKYTEMNRFLRLINTVDTIKAQILLSLVTLLTVLYLLGHISVIAISYATIYFGVIYFDKAYFKSYLSLRLICFILLTTALLLHKVPGFNNIVVYQDILFSRDAAPYSLYINFDKLIIAAALLPYILHRDSKYSQALPKPPVALKLLSKSTLAIIISMTTVLLALMCAIALELISWQPKLPAESLVFFSKMLLITVVAEECIFRGVLQRETCNKIGVLGVLLISGLFFGAVHFAFSPLYAVVSVIAGLGYGYVYYYSGSILYAIALHFILNSIHALFFTYPMIA